MVVVNMSYQQQVLVVCHGKKFRRNSRWFSGSYLQMNPGWIIRCKYAINQKVDFVLDRSYFK